MGMGGLEVLVEAEGASRAHHGWNQHSLLVQAAGRHARVEKEMGWGKGGDLQSEGGCAENTGLSGFG